MNDEERLDYEHHQTQLRHEASLYESTYVLGKLEGIEEGMEKGLLIAAKNLKQAGIDNTTIASATGLSIEQITQL
jgi:predicted transposase/invertase (TIGR01784 family)